MCDIQLANEVAADTAQGRIRAEVGRNQPTSMRKHHVADRRLVEAEFTNMIYSSADEVYLKEIKAAGGIEVYPAICAHANQLRERDRKATGHGRGPVAYP